MPEVPDTARIYTLADRRYFVGLVALLNSLRLTANEQELVVLDCGLEESQRARLGAHAEVVRLPPDVARRNVLAKPYVHELASPAEIVVWIDSDVVVTGGIGPIVEAASRGRIGVFPVDWPEQRGRLRLEWPDLFSLREPLRPQTYVNAGFYALSTARWPAFLERWWELCSGIPDGVTFHGDIDANPLWAGDQDAFNALLMSELPETATGLLPETGAVFPPDMERVRILDRERLVCSIEGAPVTMLHYSWVPKPWAPHAWRRMRRPLDDAYARLLPRILFAGDVPLALEPHEVPAWLRDGVAGAAARRWVAAARPLRRVGARAAAGLPVGLHRRLVAARDARESTRRG